MIDLKNTVPISAPLGKKSPYPNSFDNTLLQPVSRSLQRDAMGLKVDSMKYGQDIWNAYELYWLDMNGKPVRDTATLLIPAHSLNIAESKSVKLYLNSLNREKFLDRNQVKERITKDLTQVCKSPIKVELGSDSLSVISKTNTTDYECLDLLPVKIKHYQVEPSLLQIGNEHVSQKLVSHLFKSHCLCTGQPDMGSIFIDYTGKKIDSHGLLAYLISYRDHAGFSENCIEQIFCDIYEKARPEHLTVFGRFTRRGGIDINPYRSTHEEIFLNMRLLFQ